MPNNAPALGSMIAASVPLTTADKNQYILIDVTAAVQAWLSGTPNDGMALVGNSPLNATFDSKESTTTSHSAELDIVFAGGGGGITGINTASGSGLMGGGTSGTLNLSLTNACAANQVLEWNGSAWICANLSGSGTITGVTAGTDLTGGGTSGVVTLNVDTTKVPQLNAANTFTVLQTIMSSGNFDGLDSSASADGYNGVTGISYATTGSGAGVVGLTLSPSGQGVAGAGVGGGVSGLSTSNKGVGGNFIGFSVASGSGLDGTDGVVATGGNGDPSTAYGGYGVYGLGGGGAGGGDGVIGFGGGGGQLDGAGGYFIGGTNSIYGDGVFAEIGSSGAYAGDFYGDVRVSGAITAGTKDFKIDHPLDPANKYLVHASVESSEMMNIYTGNVTTDAQGEATVQLPEWFQVLNTDFRYQLTVIGQFAQAIVAREIENNLFEIRTSTPNVKVSWQVTGVRQDAYAKAHPLVVEQEKEDRVRGFYIHPDLYGAPQEKQIEWARHPQMMKKMREMRAKQQSTIRAAAPPTTAQPR